MGWKSWKLANQLAEKVRFDGPTSSQNGSKIVISTFTSRRISEPKKKINCLQNKKLSRACLTFQISLFICPRTFAFWSLQNQEKRLSSSHRGWQTYYLYYQISFPEEVENQKGAEFKTRTHEKKCPCIKLSKKFWMVATECGEPLKKHWCRDPHFWTHTEIHSVKWIFLT